MTSDTSPVSNPHADSQFEGTVADTLEEGLVPALLTVTGPDRPGVTAAFFSILSDFQVQLLDIEQSVFRGNLSLAALAGVGKQDLDSLRDGMQATLSSYGMGVQVQADRDLESTRPRSNPVTG